MSSVGLFSSAAAIDCASSIARRAETEAESSRGMAWPSMARNFDSLEERDRRSAIFCNVAPCRSSSDFIHAEASSEPVIMPTNSDVNERAVASLLLATAALANTPARSPLIDSSIRLGGESVTVPSRS